MSATTQLRNTAIAQPNGTVYLLHFDRLYHTHATTPVGPRTCPHDWLTTPRAAAPDCSRSSPRPGIEWRLARTWAGGRRRERQLKAQGGASRRCPTCGITPRRERSAA